MRFHTAACTLVILLVASMTGCRDADTPAPSEPVTEFAAPPATEAASRTPERRQDLLTATLPDRSALPDADAPWLLHRGPARQESGADGEEAVADQGGQADTSLYLRDAQGALAAIWALPPGSELRSVADGVSPDGRWLAFLSGQLPEIPLDEAVTSPLTLHVWDLGSGSEAHRLPLLRSDVHEDLRAQAPQVAEASASDSDLASGAWDAAESEGFEFFLEDVLWAFADAVGNFRWSPEGDRLAFIGAIDGPSADVYLLQVADGAVTRVSDEPTHAFRLAWSPDGRWILHEGARWSSRAAGSTVASSTDLSAADGSQQRHIGPGSGIGSWAEDWPDAWLDDDGAIYHTESNGCGICQILHLDVGKGITRTLASSIEGQSFAIHPEGGAIALSGRRFGPMDSSASTPMETSVGIEVIDVSDATTGQIHDRPCQVVGWAADDLPFLRLPSHTEDRCSPVAFDAEGVELDIDAPVGLTEVGVSPGNAWRLLYGEAGWRLFDRSSVLRAEWPAESGGSTSTAPQPVEAVAWRGDDAAWVWRAGGEVWLADLVDGKPVIHGSWKSESDRDGSLDVAWIDP